MRDWFFYQERGKTMGPLTADDLRARIRDGRIKLFDLIYKEGETGWKMAMEHPDLNEEFKKPASAGLKDRPWVCLHRKSEETFEYITLGPYSTEEIKEAIQAGKISYNDYAWMSGYLEWKRLGAIAEFNPRAAVKSSDAPTVMVPISSSATGATTVKTASAPPPTSAPPAMPEEVIALLKNVVEFKRSGKIAELEPSDKARSNSDDMTKIVSPKTFDPDATRIVNVNRKSTSVPPPVPKASEPVPPRPVSIPTPESEDESDEMVEDILQERRKKKRRSRKAAMLWTDWGIVGGLVIVLVVVLALIVRKLGNKTVPVPPQMAQDLEAQNPAAGELTPPPDFSPPPPPNLDQSEAAPEQEPEEPVAKKKVVAPPHEPTQLTLNVQNTTGSQAKIDIRSNGSSEFPVLVQIIGEPGQVADTAAFYRFMRLTPTGSAAKPLDLSGVHLPAGRFTIRAETGKLHKEVTMSLGVGEASYKQAVARTRKAFAGAVWKERLEIYKVSLRLETAIAQALISKRLSAKGLEELSAVKKANGANYIFFEDWWELKLIFNDAKERATPTELERAKRLREKIATFSVWRVK